MDIDHMQKDFFKQCLGFTVKRWEQIKEPDQDWMPCALMANAALSVLPIIIAPEYMNDTETRDNLAVMLRREARKHDAILCGIIYAGWGLPKPIPRAEQIVRRLDETGVSGQADRMEYLIMHALSPITEETYMAEVMRAPSTPPKLGAFATPDERWGHLSAAGKIIVEDIEAGGDVRLPVSGYLDTRYGKALQPILKANYAKYCQRRSDSRINWAV